MILFTSLLIVVYLSGGISASFKTFIAAATLLLVVGKHPKIVSTKLFVTYSVIGLLVFALNLFINYDHANLISYIFYPLHYILALSVVTAYYISNRNINSDIYRVLLLIGIYSAIGSALMLFMAGNMSSIYISNRQYFQIGYLFYYIDVLYSNIPRFTGFFWEPGILQIYLNILLFYSLFLYKNMKHCALAIIGVLATGSTTGYLIMVMIFIYSVFKLKRTFKLIIPLIVLVPFFAAIFIGNIEDKLKGSKITSFWARYYDSEMAIRIAADNPVFGVGFLDLENYLKIKNKYLYRDILGINIDESFIDTNMDSSGNSNSFIKIAATFGIPFFLLFLLSLLSQTVIENDKLLFNTMLIVFIITEPLALTPFFLIFFVSGAINIFYKKYSFRKNYD